MALSGSFSISRQLVKSCTFMMRPSMGTNAVRSFSVSATTLAEKPPAGKATNGAASPPKKAATPPPKAAAPPSKPAAAAPPTTTGDTYEAQEIFNYNELSFYELESAMRKSRLPQPKPGTPSD